MTDVEDDLATIHAGLEADGYYVHPSLAGQFTDDDLEALTEAQEDAPDPTYVVAWPLSTNDAYGGNGIDLLTRLHAEYDEPGVYLVTTSEDYYEYARIDGRQWDVVGERDGDLSPYEPLAILGYEEPATLGAAFPRAVELLGLPPDDLREVYDTVTDESYDPATGAAQPGSNAGEGDDGLGTVGTVGLGVLLALVVAGVSVARRRRRRRDAKPAAAPFTLPDSTVARIRAARDRELRDDTRTEVDALSRAVDRTGLDEQRSPVAWQHALEHLAAAQQVLERDDPPAVLDAVGALVLARRGRAALDAAHAGRSWSPEPGCYLNPLHDGATKPHRVSSGDRAVTAPLCGECREALREKRAPDVLDVEHDGRPRHYFETDAEPWAATGFGSLDVDLVRALQGGRR